MILLTLLAPFWRWIAGVGLILAILTGTFAYGHHKGSAAKEAEWQAKTAAEVTRQAAVRAKALDASVSRELETNKQNAALSQEVASYEQKIEAANAAPAKPGACPSGLRLSPADVGVLRRLQGRNTP